MADIARETPVGDPAAGATLAAASFLSVVVMAHHPVGYGSGSAQIVHAAMMVFIVLSVAGYATLSTRLNLGGFPNLAALVFYGAGAVGNLLAGITNGFVAPALHARGVSEDVLRWCWEFNQACAFGAVYATSAAVLIWGVILMHKSGLARFAGFVGVAAALAPAAMLIAGALTMNVAGAFIVYALQAAFGVVAGVLMLGRSI